RRARTVEFGEHDGVGFMLTKPIKPLLRVWATNLPHRPDAGGSDERFGVVEPAFQMGQRRLVALIAQDDRGIAQQSTTLGAPQRRAAEELPELFVAEPEKAMQIERAQQFRRFELSLARSGNTPIPRTNVLTEITAEDPVAHRLT